MKSGTPWLFFLSFILVIAGALLYVWSDNTPNGQLGRQLETVSIILVTVGCLSLLYDVVTKWK